jgi:hypothetical protein
MDGVDDPKGLGDLAQALAWELVPNGYSPVRVGDRVIKSETA